MTGLSSSGISTGQNSRKPNMLHDKYKTDPFHPGIQVNFGDRYPGSVIVVGPHPSQGENFTFIFKPQHNCQQLTSFNILDVCKNNVRFQPWCGVIQTCHLFHVFQQLCVNCKWNWSAGEQSPKICKLSDLSDSGIQHQSLQSWDPSHQAILIPKNTLEGFWISRNHHSIKAECEKGQEGEKNEKNYQPLCQQ